MTVSPGDHIVKEWRWETEQSAILINYDVLVVPEAESCIAVVLDKPFLPSSFRRWEKGEAEEKNKGTPG